MIFFLPICRWWLYCYKRWIKICQRH